MYNKGTRPKPGGQKGFPREVNFILSIRVWIEAMRGEKAEKGAEALEKEISIWKTENPVCLESKK